MVKYESAIRTDDNAFIHIEEVEQSSYGRKAHFICPCCKLEMRPILGRFREKHFRHKGEPCRYDKYLHSIAEESFLREYNHCLQYGTPFILKTSAQVRCNGGCVLLTYRDCKEHFITRDIDLTKRYTRISKEERVETGLSSFRRPDILLESETGEQIWIELFVTHKSEKEKIRDADRRGAKIIEIKIHDEHCEGLRAIADHLLSQTEDIVFHNIKPELIDPPEGFSPPCMKFLVYKYESENKILSGMAWRRHFDIQTEVPTELEEGFEYLVALRLNYMQDFKTPLDGRKARFQKEMLLNLKDACAMRQEGISFPEHLHDLVICEFRRPGEKAKPQKSWIPSPQTNPDSSPKVLSEPTLQPSYIKPKGIWMSLGLLSGNLWYDKDGDNTAEVPDGYVKSLPTVGDFEDLKKCSTWKYKDGLCFYDGDGNRLLFKWDTNYLLETGGTWTPTKEDGDFFAAREEHVCRYVAHKTGTNTGPIYRAASRIPARPLTDEEVEALFPKEDIIRPSYISPSSFHKEDPNS